MRILDPGSGMETVRIRDPGWKKVGTLNKGYFLSLLCSWHDIVFVSNNFSNHLIGRQSLKSYFKPEQLI